jgi:queuosine precursor transporter
VKKKTLNLFFALSLSMGLVVIISNYLVQFPINYLNLQEVLTYGAFSYPVTFLITDLANRAYGKKVAKNIVYLGFVVGVVLTFTISTNFNDLISIRIAIGSGLAFLVAQSIDINIFDRLRKNKIWYIAPLTSSLIGSAIDTLLFFSISFYNTGVVWISLAFGDFVVKTIIALIMLVPFKIFIKRIKEHTSKKVTYKTV